MAQKCRPPLTTRSLTAPLILLTVLKLPNEEKVESSSDIAAGCTIENVTIYLAAYGGPSRYATVNDYSISFYSSRWRYKYKRDALLIDRGTILLHKIV